MTTLGHDHFIDKIERLPGEEVIWEGGASRKAARAMLLKVLLAVGLVWVIFFVLYGLSEFHLVDNPDYVEPATEAQQAERDQTSDSNKSEPPEKIIDPQRLVIFWTAVLLLLIVVGVLLTRMMVRNYWLVATNERICIQSGTLTKRVVTIDIDKVSSIISHHDIIERMLGLHSLEIVHSGVLAMRQNAFGWFNPYVIHFVDVELDLNGKLLAQWLPRDNPGHS